MVEIGNYHLVTKLVLANMLLREWKQMIKTEPHEHQIDKQLFLWKSQVGAKRATPLNIKSMSAKIQYTAEIIEVIDQFSTTQDFRTNTFVERYLY